MFAQLLIKKQTTMKNYKFYTIALLFFTISTLASCIESTSKTTTTKSGVIKNTQENPIKRVDATNFNTEINGKKVQLIDVRTPREFTQGHIENAININIYDKTFTVNTDKLDKSKPIYVYCRSGVRSMKAANSLKSRGFRVVNLNGGIGGWMRNGFKLIK